MTLVVDAPEAVPADWREWPPEAKVKLRRAVWKRLRRPEQEPPPGDWRTWYLQGGRGSGKTRPAAETLAEWAEETIGEWAVVAPTYGAARDVCIEGPSGLLLALGGVDGPNVANWNRSLGELRLRNGSVIFADGADDGALRIQGKNLRGAWCDEVGLWRQWDLAWNESLAFAVRLPPARIIATGTPKAGHGLVRLLVNDPAVPKSRLRTRDNLANLDAATVADLEHRFAGTRRGRQELEGEFLTDVDGALWTLGMIDASRVGKAHFDEDTELRLVRAVVAIDPAVTSGEDSDETGIVVAARGADGDAYVLADRSGRFTPEGWGRRAVAAHHEFGCDRIIGEANNGGDLVESVLRTVDRSIPYRKVHASRGKRVRAEPIAALYEQGRVHHVGAFPELEDQMTTWTPESGESPDRMDALVWALTELMVDAGKGRGGLRFGSAA